MPSSTPASRTSNLSGTPWSVRLRSWMARRPFHPELFDAAENADASRVQALLAINPRWALGQDWTRQGQTALMLAAAAGSANCVRLLLPFSNARDVDFSGGTALMHTIGRGTLEVFHLLLPLSDPHHRDREGERAISLATQRLDADFFTPLRALSDCTLRDSKGRTLLMRAARFSPLEHVQFLLATNDPLARDTEGMTALMFASQRLSSEALRTLLPLSDAQAQDHRGRTALMCAIESQSEDLALLLLPHSNLDARLRKGPHAGRNALGLAVLHNGSASVLRELVIRSSLESLEVAARLALSPPRFIAVDEARLAILLDALPIERLLSLLEGTASERTLPFRTRARLEHEALSRTLDRPLRAPQSFGARCSSNLAHSTPSLPNPLCARDQENNEGVATISSCAPRSRPSRRL